MASQAPPPLPPSGPSTPSLSSLVPPPTAPPSLDLGALHSAFERAASSPAAALPPPMASSFSALPAFANAPSLGAGSPSGMTLPPPPPPPLAASPGLSPVRPALAPPPSAGSPSLSPARGMLPPPPPQFNLEDANALLALLKASGMVAGSESGSGGRWRRPSHRPWRPAAAEPRCASSSPPLAQERQDTRGGLEALRNIKLAGLAPDQARVGGGRGRNAPMGPNARHPSAPRSSLRWHPAGWPAALRQSAWPSPPPSLPPLPLAPRSRPPTAPSSNSWSLPTSLTPRCRCAPRATRPAPWPATRCQTWREARRSRGRRWATPST